MTRDHLPPADPPYRGRCGLELESGGYCNKPAVTWSGEPGPGGTELCEEHRGCFDPCPKCGGAGIFDPVHGTAVNIGPPCPRCHGDGIDGCRS